MKRIIKRPLKAFWRLTHSLRRPFVRKAEAFITRCCAQQAAMGPVDVTCHVSEETSLVMDHMVRELVRLQKRIEYLQEAVESLSQAGTSLSVVGGDSGDQGFARSAVG